MGFITSPMSDLAQRRIRLEETDDEADEVSTWCQQVPLDHVTWTLLGSQDIRPSTVDVPRLLCPFSDGFD
jgi:hypothetical protein